MASAKDVLNFWFGEIEESEDYLQDRSELWFMGKPAVDKDIRKRFEKTLQGFIAGRHTDWMAHPTSRLAAIIVVDQFSRHIYRGTAAAFSQDALGLRFTTEGLAAHVDQQLHPIQRVFFYLPLQHTEDLEVQKISIQLYTKLFQDVPAAIKETFEETLDYAVRHYEVIEKFGRFPHRNKALGRLSTPEEIEFLKLPGSTF